MNSAPVGFALGREALKWVMLDGRPTRGGTIQSILMHWHSYWFERNLALQRRLHPIGGSPFSPDPVFILGLWRSGTTLLHDLLSACPGMFYPATWQCMNPSTFRLRAPPLTAGKTAKRPMDGFLVNTLSPQEDEFALLALGAPSVYRAFFDPRRLKELEAWLDPEAWTVDRPAGWIALWREFLAWVAQTDPMADSRRMLLKSPNHTFRIQALQKIVPDASYVWIVRDPEEVFYSNRKMWVSMFRRYALWEWDMGDLDDFLRHAFEYAGSCLSYAIDTFSKDRLIVLEFERLIGSPIDFVEQINRRLKLGDWAKMAPNVAIAAAEKNEYRKDTYHSRELPPSLGIVIDQLRVTQRAALASHGC